MQFRVVGRGLGRRAAATSFDGGLWGGLLAAVDDDRLARIAAAAGQIILDDGRVVGAGAVNRLFPRSASIREGRAVNVGLALRRGVGRRRAVYVDTRIVFAARPRCDSGSPGRATGEVHLGRDVRGRRGRGGAG